MCVNQCAMFVCVYVGCEKWLGNRCTFACVCGVQLEHIKPSYMSLPVCVCMGISGDL